MLDPFAATRDEVKRALPRNDTPCSPIDRGKQRDRPCTVRPVRSGGTPPGDGRCSRKIPIGYARRNLLLPCRTPAGKSSSVGGKTGGREAIDEMRFLAGSNRVVCAPENEVLARIDAAYERAHSPENEIVEGFRGMGPRPDGRHRGDAGPSRVADEAPVIRFVHAVLFRAIRSGPATSTSSRTKRSWSSATGSTASSTR